MTSRQVYEGVLIELNKVNAPSMLLEDFNYLFNKAIYQYINKRYNIYDINQQTTDDIRVLKSTCILPVALAESAYGTLNSGDVKSMLSLYGATYEANLPTDYLHILNCICNFKVAKNFKCYNANTYVQFNATRLTADLWGQIINNFYMRPSYKRPYYYIHNVNSLVMKETDPDAPKNDPYQTKNNIHTNPISFENGNNSKNAEGLGTGTDSIHNFNQDTGLSRSLLTSYNDQSNPKVIGDLVERTAGARYGNATTARIEIRYGKDSSLFTLENIYIDYIKTPQHIRLTQEELDLTEDTSQMMEFPDYVCQEIINELVKLVLENSGDPRLQSNIAVNQSIANPAQQLTQQ